ncbi:Pea pathogenicity protein 2 [Apiospora arundinis]|uniref:SnoaL-like domain-containing protein n=1 Tax=Apiospora arundinis TaxID=335852 RepID=A0ABR2J4S7_9PEZI
MTTSADAQVHQYSHINGSSEDLLNRFAVSELCKGWPVYRDASEWKNYRSLFCKEAMVWTTWSKGQTVDNFIAISKRGKDRGDFIMHRECGTLVELSPSHPDRAIGKMKATITQRFQTQASQANVFCPEGAEYDVDCDCRFIFFCVKQDAENGGKEWKAKYVKLFYEKDKVVPVDGNRAPTFAPELLNSFPEGYRHLAAAQSGLGYPVTRCLPTARDHDAWHAMYGKMEQWLAGSDVDLLCDDDSSNNDNIEAKTNGLKPNGFKRKAGAADEEGPQDVRTDATRVKTSNGSTNGTHGGGASIPMNCGLDYEKNGLSTEVSLESVR